MPNMNKETNTSVLALIHFKISLRSWSSLLRIKHDQEPSASCQIATLNGVWQLTCSQRLAVNFSQ